MSQALELWGVNDPNISAQLALAHTLDLFKQETGLDVFCTFLESGTTMAQEVFRAEYQPFAFTQTPITALLLHEYGLSTKLVAPLADIAGTQQVVVQKSSSILKPQEVQGKQIGMAQGAAVYLALKNMAKDCNLNLESVRFIDLLPHEQLEAFKAKKIDILASWEPWTTKARTMGGELYFSGNHSHIPGIEGEINWLINQSCLIVPDSQIQTHPDTVLSILKVLRKATDLINHQREKVIEPLARFYGISKVELILAMQKNRYTMAVNQLFRLGILGFRDFLYDTGQISFKYSENELYDVSLLQQLDPSLVFLEASPSQDIPIVEEQGIYYRQDFTLHVTRPPLRFLLADDSRFVRLSLANAIKKMGGTVIGEASTGSEAIERFAHLRTDVITMDLSMPGVSGVEAINIIMQIDPTVNIIVISGADLQEVRTELFNNGVKMFITKPFQPEQVTAILQKRIFYSH
ncbi:MAG: response regulator [Candidatus Vecturithrix sp.]|jgi:NitT/TauT family transport system substrate-binding protein|nr:response regulator [Candidatus Vecturithrix sp.]